MDKPIESIKAKRKLRGDDEETWDCTVCTYINPSEAYTCEMCRTRKGTSTRKPRLNNHVVEQQQFIAQAILREKEDEHKKKRELKHSDKPSTFPSLPKLKNVDRSSPLTFEIFANGYSVVITEYRPKGCKSKCAFPDSPTTSNCSSAQGPSSTPLGGVSDQQLSPMDLVPLTGKMGTRRSIDDVAEYDHSSMRVGKEKLRETVKWESASDTKDELHRSTPLSASSASIAPVDHLDDLGGCPDVVVKTERDVSEEAARDGDDEREEDDESGRRLGHLYPRPRALVHTSARSPVTEVVAKNAPERSSSSSDASILNHSNAPEHSFFPTGPARNSDRLLQSSGRRARSVRRTNPKTSRSYCHSAAATSPSLRRASSRQVSERGLATGKSTLSRGSRRTHVRARRRTRSTSANQQTTFQPRTQTRGRRPQSFISSPCAVVSESVPLAEVGGYVRSGKKRHQVLSRSTCSSPPASSSVVRSSQACEEHKRKRPRLGSTSSSKSRTNSSRSTCKQDDTPCPLDVSTASRRLSSESKTTSAMTDSSGAMALEISPT